MLPRRRRWAMSGCDGTARVYDDLLLPDRAARGRHVPRVGCERSIPTAPLTPSGSSQSASSWSADSAQLTLLARGVALALRSPDVRQQVLADLRDSPFNNHAVEIGSYLRGTRGRRVLTAAAAALGVDAQQLGDRTGDARGAGR